MAQTKVQRDAAWRAADLRRAVARQLLEMRADAGLSQEELAHAAGVSQGFVARVEAATLRPTIESYAVLAAALGADLGLRIYPNTGPPIRDRHQAPIVEALLSVLHTRWRAVPEVPVRAPTRGVVDLTLHDPGPPSVLVATEVESEIRRLEQRLRWHAEKALALSSSDVWQLIRDEASTPPAVSRLLVVRSTRSNRELARRFERTLMAAHPARASDAYAALTGAAPWPGAALIWAVVDGGAARILDAPPRGVPLGR